MVVGRKRGGGGWRVDRVRGRSKVSGNSIYASGGGWRRDAAAIRNPSRGHLYQDLSQKILKTNAARAEKGEGRSYECDRSTRVKAITHQPMPRGTNALRTREKKKTDCRNNLSFLSLLFSIKSTQQLSLFLVRLRA